MTARRPLHVIDMAMIAACIAIGTVWAPLTSAATDHSAASTPAPGGTPAAPACPSAEYPAVGALRLTDGAVTWLVCSPVEANRTVVGASDQIVLINESGPKGQNRHTIALDATDGLERWRRPTGNPRIPPGPFDGQGIVVLAIVDGDGSALVGVDPLSGDERWRVTSSGTPLAHSITVAVVWESDSVNGLSRFRGLDRVTGNELWVSDTSLSDQSGVMVARSPAAVLGDIMVVPTGTTVTAIDMRTGTTLWTAPQLDHPVAVDGVVVGTRSANGRNLEIAALDAVSGEEMWTVPGRLSYGNLLAVGDGMVAVLDPDSAEVVAYELASGEERWHAARTPFAEPQFISGTSLVLLWEGELAVVSTTDGATVWSETQPFHSPLMNSVSTNGATVFVAINSLPWSD
jgi:outer membrane protein assembly factor BamB